ncbi:PspC domain-containing protein [Aestuariimicrobium ganziense]|uniref:PspC domain-containing protein n=1 Tax=Aestuariimicrobium ganziense TaxID=2773677 RepID=UPI00194522D2|nr:PspC domain-containing protein [Aestuariimicrobium ganziense]
MSGLEPGAGTPRGVLDLQRSDEGKLAGVCAALAEHWRIDPTLVRVAAVLLAVSGGIGAVLYAGGWLWMRTPEGDEPMVAKVLPGAESWPRSRVIGVLVLAAIVATIVTGQLLPFGPGPLIVLGLAAYFAHRARRPQESVPTQAPMAVAPFVPAVAPLDPSTDFGRAVRAWQARLDALDRGVVDPPRPLVAPAPVRDNPYAAAAALPVPTKAHRPARRRLSWWYTWVALGSSAAAWAITSQVVTGASTVLLASVSLATIAVFLLVGAFLGRPRLLVTTGLALGLVVILGLSPTMPGQSHTKAEWSTTADVPADISLTGQTMTVKAGQLVLTADQELSVDISGGALNIDLPSDTPVTIHYTLSGGALTLPGDQAAVGWSEGEMSSGPADGPRLTITIRVTAGAVVIE